jgi:hypothetical protein
VLGLPPACHGSRTTATFTSIAGAGASAFCESNRPEARAPDDSYRVNPIAGTPLGREQIPAETGTNAFDIRS